MQSSKADGSTLCDEETSAPALSSDRHAQRRFSSLAALESLAAELSQSIHHRSSCINLPSSQTIICTAAPRSHAPGERLHTVVNADLARLGDAPVHGIAIWLKSCGNLFCVLERRCKNEYRCICGASILHSMLASNQENLDAEERAMPTPAALVMWTRDRTRTLQRWARAIAQRDLRTQQQQLSILFSTWTMRVRCGPEDSEMQRG